MSTQVMKELSDAARYDILVDTAQKEIPKKRNIEPKRPDVEEITDDLDIQSNLAKTNLKEITNNAPALVNNIEQYLRNNEYLTDFNKYFVTFKKVIGAKKYRSLDKFNNDWYAFLSQKLGTTLELPKETQIVSETQLPPITTPSDYENLSDKILDAYFRKALLKKYGKIPDNFKYRTTKGKESEVIDLEDVDGIFRFKARGGFKRGDIVPQNNIKIKFIWYNTPETEKLILGSPKWKGSTESGEGVRMTTGSGIKAVGNLMHSKKKLVHIHFP